MVGSKEESTRETPTPPPFLHRRDLKRIDEHFAKAKEHHDKAEYFRQRAAAAESNVIIFFSNDPDATEKLVDKIERLKKRQGVMKRANHLIPQSGSRRPRRPWLL